MPDIPKQAAVMLQDALRNTIKASDAVKHGIATHAEKHAATKHKRHAELEANKKLESKVK